ncbi:hypothetical protein Y032_0011g1293 [Ancylostoma ceylanicum]|uniref:Uncharacterized protein n=1 Tax=Ancylostoma ceylanicum TaxID=53326 RepID=A0A016VD97_9BILA|nr:hypothetical protein Y032_0011g1293 [Ancylostoma ceylanicum]
MLICAHISKLLKGSTSRNPRLGAENTTNDDPPAEKQGSLSRPRRPFKGPTRQLTLSPWVVWCSGRMQCIPFTRFRGGTQTHPTAEHSSAPSTHGKERLYFLHFSLLSRSFIPAYEFNVPKNPEIQGNLQREDFRGRCL